MQKYKEFIEEKKYLANVSPKTIQIYEHSFAWVEKYCPEGITEAGILEMVKDARRLGRTTSTINTRLGVVKTYCKWAGIDVKVQMLKEGERVVRIFSPEDIRKLISYRPKSQRRVHTLALVLLDTGLRLDEALGMKISDVDMDNLLLTVRGKGDKDRKVPMSFELRRALFTLIGSRGFGFVFSVASGAKYSKRNAYRDFMALCKKLGINPPPRAIHALRSTFAVGYLRNGGNTYYLQRILGHTSGRMTEKYLRAVQVDDLSAVHQRLSILSR